MAIAGVRESSAAIDRILLAMVLWRQGKKEAARARRSLGEEWFADHPPPDESFRIIREEAAALME